MKKIMKKNRKKLWAKLFILGILLLTPLDVYAVGTDSLIENYEIDQNIIKIICARPDRMEDTGCQDSFQITLDGTELLLSDIIEQLKSSLLIEAEVLSFPENSNAVQLGIIYTAADGSRYEDSVTVFAEDFILASDNTEEILSTAAVEEENSSEDDSAETALDEEDADENVIIQFVKDNKWLCIGIGAAIMAVIIIIIVVVIVLRRKSKKRAALNNTPSEKESWQQNDITSHDIHQEPNYGPTVSISPIPSTEAVKKLELKLTAIGHKDIIHKITLYEDTEVSIGRSSKANVILDPDDRQISGLHCVMKWKNNKIYVSDMGSKNDTYVNGIPIKKMGRVVINKGDTIRIGSYEYRIG